MTLKFCKKKKTCKIFCDFRIFQIYLPIYQASLCGDLSSNWLSIFIKNKNKNKSFSLFWLVNTYANRNVKMEFVKC